MDEAAGEHLGQLILALAYRKKSAAAGKQFSIDSLADSKTWIFQLPETSEE